MTSLDKEFKKLEKQIEKISKHRTDTIARNHKKVLDDLRFILSKIYEKYEIEGQVSFNEMKKYNRIGKLDKEITTKITELYKTNKRLLKGHLTSIANDVTTETIEIIEGVTKRKLKGIIKEIDVTKTINKEMAGLKWTDRLNKHRDDVIYQIQKEVRQGLSQGDTYGTMANRVKKELSISTNKSNTIVRTESMRVHAESKKENLDSIAKHGIKMKKEWISSVDERTRDTHIDLHGTIIDYDEDFDVGGYPAFMPMDSRLPAEETINCRCIISTIIVDEEK